MTRESMVTQKNCTLLEVGLLQVCGQRDGVSHKLGALPHWLG